MTNKEICEAFIAHYQMTQQGKMAEGEVSFLLPYFLADASQEYYTQSIAQAGMRHKCRHFCKEWQANYHRFMKGLFNAFDADTTDAVIDKMDEFGKTIGNDLMIAKLAYMDAIAPQGFDLAEQKIISSIMIANILAQDAQIVWADRYVGKNGKGTENVYLTGMRLATCALCKEYLRSIHKTCTITEAQEKKIDTAVKVLQRRIRKWMETEREGAVC